MYFLITKPLAKRCLYNLKGLFLTDPEQAVIHQQLIRKGSTYHSLSLFLFLLFEKAADRKGSI